MNGNCSDCGKPKPNFSAERCWDCHVKAKGAAMRPMGGEKTCSMCEQVKPLEQFHRFANASDGHRAECKVCANARAKKYYDDTVRSKRDTGPVAGVCQYEACGREYEYVKTTGPRRKYCSDGCKQNGGEALKRNRAAKSTRACACGSTDVQKVGKPVCPNCRKDPRDNASNWARERRRILRTYNITQADWDVMVARQGNRCAVCETDTPGGRGESWCIDHDHRCCPDKGSCGQCVRGLLCSRCNLFIGYAGDNPARLRAGADYVERRQPPGLSVAA